MRRLVFGVLAAILAAAPVSADDPPPADAAQGSPASNGGFYVQGFGGLDFTDSRQWTNLGAGLGYSAVINDMFFLGTDVAVTYWKASGNDAGYSGWDTQVSARTGVALEGLTPFLVAGIGTYEVDIDAKFWSYGAGFDVHVSDNASVRLEGRRFSEIDDSLKYTRFTTGLVWQFD